MPSVVKGEEVEDTAIGIRGGAGTGVTGLFLMDYFQARGELVTLDITDGIDEALVLLEENVGLWKTTSTTAGTIWCMDPI
jgi:hypothetical protein